MQPIKKKIRTKKKNNKDKKIRYGTSKLEEKFAREFLDKLGIKYVYQYEVKSIGRFYDFRLCDKNGVPNGPIIEIQGSYWHGDKRLYEDNELNRIQIRSKKVDEYKRKWCSKNGIKILYIWEMDINKTPDIVLKYLKDCLTPYCKNTDVLKKNNIKRNDNKNNE